MSRPLPGKVALVTGASSGLGAEFARQLGARGFDLILVARRVERLEKLAADLTALGRAVEVLPVDLGDRADVDRVAARLADDARPVDVLVNNAGYAWRTPVTTPDPEHDRVYEVMQRAPMVLAAAVAAGMAARGRGTIINVSSLTGLLTSGVYAASRSWMITYSQALALELKDTGVGVTTLLPGWVRTEFHNQAGGRRGIPGPLWVDVEPVVRICLRDAAAHRVVSVPTVRYRVIGSFLRHAPRGIVRAISAEIMGRRRAEAIGTR
jgi:short-subunit dehydrogenase